MLSAQDATRMSDCGKEEDINYHFQQMEYYLRCAESEQKELGISLKQFRHHLNRAESIQLDLEGVC